MTPTGFGCAPFVVLAGVLAAVLGCAGPTLASPEEFERAESKLLSPFVETQTLAATTFEITMTANFFQNHFSHRPTSHTQTHTRTPMQADGAVTHTYKDAVPGVTPMLFKLGNTDLVIVNSLIVHVLGGTNELTLVAQGTDVTLHRGNDKQVLGNVEIRDGSFRRNR